jgi:hypothetical protein
MRDPIARLLITRFVARAFAAPLSCPGHAAGASAYDMPDSAGGMHHFDLHSHTCTGCDLTQRELAEHGNRPCARGLWPRDVLVHPRRMKGPCFTPPAPAPESALPAGLIRSNGVLMYECRVCLTWTEWPADADFELDHPHNMCGRSPWCCP